MREIDQTGEHVIDHQQRRIGSELVALRGLNHGQRRTGLQCGGDESMPVMNVALDREISLARRDGAAIDREARDAFRQQRR